MKPSTLARLASVEVTDMYLHLVLIWFLISFIWDICHGQPAFGAAIKSLMWALMWPLVLLAASLGTIYAVCCYVDRFRGIKEET